TRSLPRASNFRSSQLLQRILRRQRPGLSIRPFQFSQEIFRELSFGIIPSRCSSWLCGPSPKLHSPRHLAPVYFLLNAPASSHRQDSSSALPECPPPAPDAGRRAPRRSACL